ncbi:protein ELYS isoform X1 [Anolis sagrei]|uniref:protein ELYS isoform X1 n=1 Tax=Anolis sagrei TaxID=38937 RepID=UPI0035218DE8
MRDLRAHVTSNLLQFPEVTVQALGEDELAIDCVLHGKFTGGRSGLACLACGPQLEIVNTVTGERLSAYRFSGPNEQPPIILTVKEFSWQKRTGLLVGLEETEGSVLCLYDLGISRVIKAVVLPGRVTAIEPIINHGGASLTTQHLHQSLRWLFGVAAVVTDVGHVFLIDLCLDDLSCSQNEIEASDLEIITGISPEVPQTREITTRNGRHLCFQLLKPSGNAVTTLSYIHRTNQLVVGFSDGYLSLWNMKTLKKEYHSQLEGGRIPVYAVTFQEPENDPRNCCYLWAVQSTQESEGDILSLHLLQLAFSDRRRLASGQIMYEGLEYCEERYTLDLTCGIFSLRGQSSNTKLIGCQTVEKFRSHVDREDGINEVISPDTSVSVFSWQVNTYGQGKPNTYLGIFDINRWYHAQMPDSLRPGEFLHNCPYFALWSLDAIVSMTSPRRILDVLVHERSFSRGVPPSYPPPEQFFNPSTYNFDATCLLDSGVVHLTCTGFQKDTLHFLKKSASSLNEAIPDGYNRCLVAGLLSPRFLDVQPSSLTQEEQFEAVLSAAIQTSSLGFLTSCIKQWTAGEQPDSATKLRFVLEWTWNKVVNTKEDFVRLCVPLFDGSSNFIDPQTLQSLQHCELLLSNLSTVLNCFVMEAKALSEKGITNLTNKQVVAGLLSQYMQVVIWFCRSNLLPESSDEDTPLSKPFYNYQHIQRFYAGCRQKLERLSRGKWNPNCLMIDGMISQLGDSVVNLWQRDDGGTDKYPPPTLHALLDLYLSESIEELYKHAISIYLLLDIMHSCPNRTDTSVDSFPTAFAIPIGLVNLIQGFWCLDHNDYENSLAYLFHPATLRVSWQHTRIIQALMCQGEHKRALRYIQTMKPSMMSSSEVMLHLTILLFNSCMVEAWSVLRQHSTRLNVEEMLKHIYEICQELGLMEDLLKLPFTETEQECLQKFLQTSAGVNNHEFLLVHHLQRANYIPALQLNQSLKHNLMSDRDPRWKERSVVRNSILDQYGKVLPRVQRKLAAERAKPYHLSSSIRREIMRPKPLSTVAKQVAAGNVITKSTFINNVLSKIGEVWVGTEEKNKSFHNEITEEALPSMPSTNTELLDPFVGTPVTKSLRKCSRLLDLVVQPASLGSPPLRSSRVSDSCMLSSPLHSNPRYSLRTLLPKNIARAPELKLLETPPVVKRAKALTSISSSGFTGFTPQSILRSSLRTTPLATPTSSPGRSITPPVRAKETKISFLEENKASQWTVPVTDCKARHSAVSSEYNTGTQLEDMWTKQGKTPSFSMSSLHEDHEHRNLSLEIIQGNHLDETDTSKGINTICVTSAHPTSNYYDSELPVDYGSNTFVASQTVHLFSEDTVNIPSSAESDDSETAESDPLEMEQQTSPEVKLSIGLSDKETLPKDEVLVMDHLNAVEDTVDSFVPPNESGTDAVEASVPSLLKEGLPAESNAKALELNERDEESVISIPDSDDMASIHSNDELEVVALEEDKAEAKEEISVVLQEEAPLDSEPEIQDRKVIGDRKQEASVAETEMEALPNLELCPSNNLHFQYNCDTVEEQQVTYDVPDKDIEEPHFNEGEGELILSDNNFSLILEGDEEAETENAAALDTSLVSHQSKVEGQNNNQEYLTNTVSTVTSDVISQSTAEVLPYVPEPIQVAIAENLLDVIKDTRSKELATEAVEQSDNESINKKVSSSPQSPFEKKQVTELSQVEGLVVSNACATEQLTQSLNVPLPDDQPLTETKKAEVLVLPTPRRSSRRAKETSYIPKKLPPVSSEESQDQQALQTLLVPVTDATKAKDSDLEESTKVQTVVQGSQATMTPRGRPKKQKKLISELHEYPNEQPSSGFRRSSRHTTSLRDQEGSQYIIDHAIQMTVKPKSAKKLKAISFQLTDNEISDQTVESSEQLLSPKPSRMRSRKHDILQVISETEKEPEKPSLTTPVRRGRMRKSSLPEATSEPDIQPAVPPVQEGVQNTSVLGAVPGHGTELIEQTPIQPRKRGRPRKNPLNVSANSQLHVSQLSPPQTDSKTVVATRRNTRSRALNQSTRAETSLPLQESTVDTPKRRTAKSVSLRIEEREVENPLPEERSVQSRKTVTSARSSGRRPSKMTSIRKRSQLSSRSEESTEEEKHLPQGTSDPEELQSADMTKLRLNDTGTTLVQHGTHRTRNNKKGVDESFSLDEAFYFSPPLTKLTEKSKGEKAVTPVQLKTLEAGLTSQFVFSPPVLRSRKKQASSISRIVEELELPIKEEKDAISIESIEKPKITRSRATKSKGTKRSKNLGKESSWSPPPMEIQFISPFGTPIDGTKSKQRETLDKAEKAVRKTVHKKERQERRLSSYPKPVVRKKML